MAIAGSAVLPAVLAVYLLSGGRLTIILVVSVIYILFRKDIAKHLEEMSAPKEKPHKCCGGKGGAGCCSSGGKKPGKKCCGGSGCSSKSKPEPVASETDFMAVDFTTEFSKPATTLEKKLKKLPKKFSAKPVAKSAAVSATPATSLTTSPLLKSHLYIFYTSLTGAAQRSAQKLKDQFAPLMETTMLNLDEVEYDSYFVSCPENATYIMVIPSYDVDSPLDYFLQTLTETSVDFRVDKFPLKKLVGFGVLGVGDSESWPEKFCYQAKQCDTLLAKLGGRRIFPVGTVCMKHEGDAKVDEWVSLLDETMKDDSPMLYQYDESDDETPEDNEEVDMEDIGNTVETEVKQMVAKDSPTYKNLTKQGYTVVGSHSGVKICRWTKSALRGRGSCYKFAFYGIKSHLCMETTPSLSCSNKCVFCWRHGTNPVGTNWRWEVDMPDVILSGALDGHYKKIKQMRGVPGVVSERFQEAFQVKHCALSLVGEPIFYPYINEFLGMLHEKEISSFLVCNAQHPDQLAALSRVTQLYVSIDAASKTALKQVDRPLFKDFWERLLRCLDILRTTQSHQRTVFRLTLVKGHNMSDISGYADLVERARPALIEIKGATFCGSSAGNGNPLTMQNIPFYEECKKFVEGLNDELERRGLGYGIAAEHAHSCCILVASNQFKINGQWHTHIDYPKFFQLLKSGEKFGPVDYVKPTPDWAIWGSEGAGFNPEDTRWKRNKKVEE